MHPAGKTAQYTFQVTPDVITRYKVELFRSSTATTPLVTSPGRVIYVSYSRKLISKSIPPSCGTVCRNEFQYQISVPTSALGTEIAKKVYFYFSYSVGPHKYPAAPKTIALGGGNPQVTVERISATAYKETLRSFTGYLRANGRTGPGTSASRAP